MTDQLDQATNSELDKAFAVEVAKRTGTGKNSIPYYTTRVDLVLPWLEKTFVAFQWNPDDRALTALRHGAHRWDITSFGSVPLESGAFARAAVIALIRAQRATSSGTSSTAPTLPPR